jgi:hypothetical protein
VEAVWRIRLHKDCAVTIVYIWMRSADMLAYEIVWLRTWFTLV